MAVLSFAAFVAISTPRPWRWGVVDCSMWMADWCAYRWGIDPAAPFRQRYSSEAEAEALIAEAGSLIALIRPQMGFLTEKQEAAIDDVGVIEVMGRQTAAIRVDDAWAFRTPRGIGFLDVPALIVWGD